MAPQNSGEKRVRAWVLVQAAPVQGVSVSLRNLDKTKDELVVIRADVVAEAPGLPYNIVVPVDAGSEPVLLSVLEEIKGVAGVSNAVALRVLKHRPTPPHDAQCYVTEDEVNASRRVPKDPTKRGRHGASPGYNGWG